MATIGEIHGIRTPNRYVVNKSLPNDSGIVVASKELIGIEVEVENVISVETIAPMWNTTGDGSLRNNGIEFISRPIGACDAPASLQSLLKTTLPANHCFSPRTSVHIHLNMTADGINVAEDIILLYSVFERVLYKFVGRQRIKNIYCVPITETDLLQRMGIKGLRAGAWQKYTGLNAVTLQKHGTLEFRHMHGTNDLRKLVIWIDLITSLKTYCLSVGTKQVRAMIAAMDDKSDFQGILEQVFGSSSQYLKFNGLEDVADTYRMAKMGLIKAQGLSAVIGNYSTGSVFAKLRNV